MELPEIDRLLQRAADQLQVGELLHGDSFSMFEAMSAVEIGDPKLDAGVPAHSSPRAAPEAPAATQLSSADVLAVADRLFAAEATWHQGSPLAQTVFTCLYLLEPHRVEEGNLPLRALCRAVHASSILVRDLILAGNVCEDEDFVIHVFGVQQMMHARGADVSALEDIALAIDLLSAPDFGKDHGRAQAASLWAAADVPGLLCRLRFREALLKALQRVQKSTKQDLQLARKQLHLAKAQLAELQQTSHPHPEAAPGFDPDANRNLMAPVPSKPVELLSCARAWERLSKLLDELLLVCEVSKVTSYAELKAFLYAFAARSCGAIARSALHMSLSGKGGPPGDLVGPWLPRRPMLQAALKLPAEALLSPETDLFIEQACLAVGGWCQDMCLNRARQRRRHRRAIEDWFHLSEHAISADGSPGFQDWLHSPASPWHWPPEQEEGQGPLMCWVEKECAHMLLQHLVLGFELELYAPEEFCMMFWYCDYLYGIVQQDAQRLLRFTSADAPYSPSRPSSASGKPLAPGKHRKADRQKKHVSLNGPADTDLLAAEVKHAQLHRQLCQSHMRLMAGLSKSGYLGSLPSLFNTEEERFQQRFAALSVLFRPEPLTYDQYRTSMFMTGKHATDILRIALEGFSQSRGILTSLALVATSNASKIGTEGVSVSAEELQGLDKMAAQNVIASKVLLNSMLLARQVEQQLPQHAVLQNGHASLDEDDRPKPCVPEAEQIRPELAPAATASDSTEVANGMPSQQAPGNSTQRDEGSIAARERSRKPFRMEWDFTQHAKYPVMRLRQAGKMT